MHPGFLLPEAVSLLSTSEQGCVRFYYDGADQLHCSKHSVTEAECLEVFDDTLEDRAGKKGSRVAIGKTNGGRYLRVIYVAEENSGKFVVTAIELTPREKQALRKRLRKKGSK